MARYLVETALIRAGAPVWTPPAPVSNVVSQPSDLPASDTTPNAVDPAVPPTVPPAAPLPSPTPDGLAPAAPSPDPEVAS